MMVILSFQTGQQCRPTRAQLLDATGFAENTLENHLRGLRAAGLLNTLQVRDNDGRARVIYIPFPPYPDHGKKPGAFGNRRSEEAITLPQFLG